MRAYDLVVAAGAVFTIFAGVALVALGVMALFEVAKGATMTTQREAFEKWWQAEESNLLGTDAKQYAWLGWQASRIAALEEAATVLRSYGREMSELLVRDLANRSE